MANTSQDVCREALRHIGVLGIEQQMPTAYYSRAKTHLDAILVELDDVHKMAIAFTAETVPDSHFLGLSIAVGGSVAPGFQRPQFAGERERGIGMLRDLEFPADDPEPVQATFY